MIDIRLSDGSLVRIDTDDPAAAVAAGRTIDGNRARAGTGADSGPSVGIGGPPSTQIPDPLEAPLPAPRPVPEPSALENAARGLQIGSQGVAEIGGDILGFPGDMADMIGSAIRDTGGAALGGINSGIEALTGVSGGQANQRMEEMFPGITGIQQPEAVIGNLVGGVLPGSEEIKQGFGDMLREGGLGDLIIPESEMAPHERIAKTINEFGGGALTGSTGLLKAAPAIKEGAQRAGKLVPELFRPAASAIDSNTAGRLLVGDTAAGAGAGAALQGSQEFGVSDEVGQRFGPEAELFTNMLATLVGGFGGNFAGRLATGTAGEALQAIKGGRPRPENVDLGKGKQPSDVELDTAAFVAQNEASNKGGALNRMGDRVDELSTDPAFADTGNLRPDEFPTTGALTQDRGLAALEQRARSANPVAFAERDANQAAVKTRVTDAVAPEGDGRAFTDEFEGRAATRRAEAAGKIDEAQGIADDLAAVSRKQGDELAAEGAQGPRAAREIDEVVSGTTEAEQASKNALFNDPAIAGERRGLTFLQEALDAETASGGGPASEIPGNFKARIRRLRETDPETGEVISDGSLSVDDLQKRRQELSGIQADARRKGNFALADSAGRLKKAIADDFEALAAEGGPAGEAAQKALDNFATRFGPTFARGRGDAGTEFRAAFNQSRFERTNTPPSATANRFIRPGSPERAESLQRIIALSEDPAAANKAAREFLLADLVSGGVVDSKTGAINGVKLGKWRQKWGDETLDTAAPGLAKELRDLADNVAEEGVLSKSIKDEIAAAKAAAKLTETEITKGALGFALGKDPKAAVNKIFKGEDSERAMAAIAREIGDDEVAKAGLKQAVREWLLDTKNNPASGVGKDRAVNVANLSAFFDANAGTLGEVFSPTEMNKLRQVQKLLADEEILRAASGTGNVAQTPRAVQGQKVERAVEATLKLKFGVLKGGGIMRALKIGRESLPGNDFEANVNKLIEQMALDPELAAHLLKRDLGPSGAPWNATLQRLIGVTESAKAVRENEDQ